jgi:hypothetical protein
MIRSDGTKFRVFIIVGWSFLSQNRFVVHPFGGSFVFLDVWVLPFYSLYSPFFGCFGLFLIGRKKNKNLLALYLSVHSLN